MRNGQNASASDLAEEEVTTTASAIDISNRHKCICAWMGATARPIGEGHSAIIDGSEIIAVVYEDIDEVVFIGVPTASEDVIARTRDEVKGHIAIEGEPRGVLTETVFRDERFIDETLPSV